MNPNTNTNPNNSTTTSGTGSGIGNRFRGAAEVVHGEFLIFSAGEGLRGTLLGAVDTVVKNGLTQNDEIARQGRVEVERGMARMKEQTATDTTVYGNATSGVSNNATHGAPHATSGATYAPGFGAGTTSGGVLHPNHHREDAVVGISQDELHDVQSHAAQSHSLSQEPQGWHTKADGVNIPAAAHGVGFANGNIASAEHAPSTGVGGAHRPIGIVDQNIRTYPTQGKEVVARNGQLDQGGHATGTRGLDERSGLN